MCSTLAIVTTIAALTGPGPEVSPAAHAASPAVVRASAIETIEAGSTNPAAAHAPAILTPEGPAAVIGSEPAEPPRRDYVMMRDCLVSLIEDIDVAAQEDGLLTHVEAREGMHVSKDLKLAQVDDREAQARYSAATSAHQRAKTEAENDVNVRFAAASAEAAKAEYDQGAEANAKFSGAVTVSEMRRRKLAWDKAVLSIEQAKMEQQKARHEMEAKAEEMQLAKLGIDRRKVISPFGGLVISVKKRPGAWVTKGEPLLRMVRMDRLRVAGHVNAAHYGPQEVAGRAVSIRAHLERGRAERFIGKVTFVHPEQVGSDYLVWAEVENRQDDEQWVLRPGLKVEMAIHLAPGSAATR